MHMALEQKLWTIAELHRLPDDGNKYEVVRGELFVTPAPTEGHETLAALLSRLLEPYVRENDLGLIFHPRAVFRVRHSEVEPDLMIRRQQRGRHRAWLGAPLPILIVEILSPSTRRRDHVQKRDFYLDEGIPEYWIVDPEEWTIRVSRPDAEDVVADKSLIWRRG
ncbi:MAG: Uma2 family endonuclease, partial [Gemmatimonadaceae bacterium]